MRVRFFYKSKAFRRNDTSTVELDKQTLKQLIIKGQHRAFDAVPVEVSQLSHQYLEKKLQKIIGIEKLNVDILKTLELLDSDSKLTQAGLLIADQHSDPVIDLVRFGPNQDIILNRHRINGISLLEAYDRAVDFFRDYYQYQQISGIQRQTVQMIPENAFREALAKALVHRD